MNAELEEVTDEQLYQDAAETARTEQTGGENTPPATAQQGQSAESSEQGAESSESASGNSEQPAGNSEQADEADPYAKYKADNGLYLGRYKTIEDAFEGMRQMDRERGRENYERGQQRGGQPHQQQGQEQPDPVHLAGLLRQPPVKNLADQAFVSVGERLGIAWNTDENGYVLTSDPVNLANAQFVRERMGGYVQETQYQEQAREQHAASLYDAAMRDTGDVDPVFVDAAFRALYEQGATGQRDWDTPEAFLSDVRAMARQRLDAAFARRAGTQQQKPQAPPPTLAGGQPTVGAGGARKGNVPEVDQSYYFR